MKTKQPTKSQIKTAVAWLRAVQDLPETPACKAVADWLEAIGAETAVAKAAKRKGMANDDLRPIRAVPR